MAMSVVALSLCQIIGIRRITGKIRWEGTFGDVQPPAQGRVSQEIKPGCSGLSPARTEKPQGMGMVPPPWAMFLGCYYQPCSSSHSGSNIWLCCVFDVYSLCSLFFTTLSLSKRGISLPLQFPPFLAGLLHLASLLMHILAHTMPLPCRLSSAEVFNAVLITVTSEEFLP